MVQVAINGIAPRHGLLLLSVVNSFETCTLNPLTPFKLIISCKLTFLEYSFLVSQLLDRATLAIQSNENGLYFQISWDIVL